MTKRVEIKAGQIWREKRALDNTGWHREAQKEQRGEEG